MTLSARIEAVRARADIGAVIGHAVKLRGRGNLRGACPFHGSKSDSLAVYAAAGRARCWGCGWTGDAIQFVQDFYGLDFKGALERLESENGLDGMAAAPLARARRPQAYHAPEVVDSGEVARHLWASAVTDHDAVCTWLRARGVPEAALDARLLGQIRFCASAPIGPWPVGKGPDAAAHAPAMVGLIRRLRPCHLPAAEGHASANAGPDRAVMPGGLVAQGGRDLIWRASGVHATYLSPGLKAKMNRKRANGDPVPARKMFGHAAGGAVILGRLTPGCPLFVGEGIETVLSGMAMLGAGADACGLAVLSLDNLQGRACTRSVRQADGGTIHGVLPLYDVQPDAERLPVCFAHDGPVTGLIDADMAPLKGMLHRETGVARGLPVIERRGGPVVHRAIGTIERAEICADLFTRAWRMAGTRQVKAERLHAGMDFNDGVRGAFLPADRTNVRAARSMPPVGKEDNHDV